MSLKPPENPITAPSGSSAELPAEARITLDELSRCQRTIVLDVRAPLEFAEDSLPGAVHEPLFNDQERAVVGTLFRLTGPRAAKEWAEGRVMPRLGHFTRRLERAFHLPTADQDRAGESGTEPSAGAVTRVVCCSRGGQRSRAVVGHLRQLGHPVLQLVGGYRAYRTRVRSALDSCAVPRPVVLHGLTGCGKTRIVRAIAARFPRRVVDLEGLAGHRSSVLGDIGLEPVGQKRFESRLVRTLEQLEGPWTLLEWEARRLGNRQIPDALYELMKNGLHFELRTPLDLRLDNLLEEYLGVSAAECRAAAASISERLAKLECYSRMGSAGVEEATTLLAAGRYRDAARLLLERHYDPRYEHAPSLPAVTPIDVRDFDGAAAEIVDRLSLLP